MNIKKNTFLILIFVFLLITIVSANNLILGEHEVNFNLGFSGFFEEKEYSTDFAHHDGETLPDTKGNRVSWKSDSAILKSEDGTANITLIVFDKPGLASTEDLIYEVINELDARGFNEASFYGANDDWEIDDRPSIVGHPKNNKDNLYIAAYWLTADTNVLIVSEYPFNGGTSSLLASIHIKKIKK